MTLELNNVARQIKTLSASWSAQQPERDRVLEQAQTLLKTFSEAYSDLSERVARAEAVKQHDRFGWIGAAPTREPMAQAYPCPPHLLEQPLTVIASDGSQILPDQHAILPYYLINVGCIIFRHGSNQKPETYSPDPILCFEPFDEMGRLVSTGEINVRRDLAELEVLVNRVRYLGDTPEPVVAVMDGQLALRVIDLPFDQQTDHQTTYLGMLNTLQQAGVHLAAYIDRPRSTYVLSLLRLALLEVGQITEDTLQTTPFRYLTDLQVFDFLQPGERSAIFTLRAKGYEPYITHGHAVHFFFLNVSPNPETPHLARVEIPAWVADRPDAVDIVHAGLVRQARITGGYPYVLARADELAVISNEEREAVEMMLAVEMRRMGMVPTVSLKQFNKTLYRFSSTRRPRRKW